MKFGEVIEALEKGLPIRRALWEEDIYTCYNADNYMFIDVFIDGQTIENQYPALKMSDLIADDWEIHEWDESEEEDSKDDEVRPCPEFAKEIIEDYKLAVKNGEIIRGEDLL